MCWARPASADRLIYEEKDTSFYIGLEKTRSEKFICISEHSTESNEYRCAPASAPDTVRRAGAARAGCPLSRPTISTAAG